MGHTTARRLRPFTTGEMAGGYRSALPMPNTREDGGYYSALPMPSARKMVSYYSAYLAGTLAAEALPLDVTSDASDGATIHDVVGAARQDPPLLVSCVCPIGSGERG